MFLNQKNKTFDKKRMHVMLENFVNKTFQPTRKIEKKKTVADFLELFCWNSMLLFHEKK